MTALFIVFGILALAASVAFVIGAATWVLRQVGVDDGIDWEDCL